MRVLKLLRINRTTVVITRIPLFTAYIINGGKVGLLLLFRAI